MSGTDLSKPAKVIHDRVVEHIGVSLQPGVCESIADSIVGDHVPVEQVDESYQAGVRDTLAKTLIVGPAIQALREAKKLLSHAKAWEGPEEWRDEQLTNIDDLITQLS